jgi:predicted helicase
MILTFQNLLNQYRKDAFLFKCVLLWNEFPGKHDLGGNDTGIDLVALTHEGDY